MGCQLVTTRRGFPLNTRSAARRIDAGIDPVLMSKVRPHFLPEEFLMRRLLAAAVVSSLVVAWTPAGLPAHADGPAGVPRDVQQGPPSDPRSLGADVRPGARCGQHIAVVTKPGEVVARCRR